MKPGSKPIINKYLDDIHGHEASCALQGQAFSLVAHRSDCYELVDVRLIQYLLEQGSSLSALAKR